MPISSFPSGSRLSLATSKNTTILLSGPGRPSVYRESPEHDWLVTDTRQTSFEGTRWLSSHQQTDDISNAGYNPNKNPNSRKLEFRQWAFSYWNQIDSSSHAYSCVCSDSSRLHRTSKIPTLSSPHASAWGGNLERQAHSCNLVLQSGACSTCYGGSTQVYLRLRRNPENWGMRENWLLTGQ